ncbi:DUF4142 domain-containing protein [Pseudomonas sp. ZM23]|uniref:DUF4142 domain-containing protein n=1 Tax=Pseudomonas triclosanedens TaxID=2961893 RepID=A0ABY7A505_9PSED|nr:DUF4142 domain-containing protein [Pseudomonas triclosanedens]MCP8466272.1 DUF4142 domain-containing protein [Pseudomonas triclosanedens]MCP8471798.1 DUF4142 domain-containing protein [Pseudomonas triclosanedens]MCP8478493.1 DUF4142 domain-containing protein [Pseudomonas triclosanedens]WAI52311.1 DUF4142 domain-containing protein [Pseudomonas triclosanedens]
MNTTALLRGALLCAFILPAGPLLAADQDSAKDQHFVTEASAAGMAEIDAAKLALKKSQSPDVKTFAQHIIDDHSKANATLKTLAEKHRLQLAESASLTNQAKAKVLDVREESFDAAYANNQVGAHEEAVKLFTDAANNASDTDIRKFAQDTLPVLQQHLEMAQDLVKAHPSE